MKKTRKVNQTKTIWGAAHKGWSVFLPTKPYSFAGYDCSPSNMRCIMNLFRELEDTCLTAIRSMLLYFLYALLAIIGIIILLWAFLPEAQAEELNIVIETIAREASSESLEAQIMVARVIITRAEERGLTYEQVCLQPYQFSCWNKGVTQKERTKAEIEKAKKAWELALRRDERVTHYHDLSVKPYWIKSMKFIRQIGRLRFYCE